MNDMKTVVSTERVPPASRLDFWTRHVRSHLTELECSTPIDGDFLGSIVAYPAAPAGLIEIETATRWIARANPTATSANKERAFVCIQIKGVAIVEQDSRQGILRAGDITLLDASKPFVADFSLEMAQLVLQVPRTLIRKQLGTLERFVATVVPFESPLGKMTGGFIRALTQNFEQFPPETARRLNEQALDMVAMAFMSVFDRNQPATSSVSRSMLACRARAFIETNLRDSSLSPTDVAQHLGISTRYLSSVFAGDGLSFERFVRERRLHKCAGDLKDHGQAMRPIGDIAYAWGFNNVTHFSQSFKTTFGTTPRDFRKQAAPQRSVNS
ncbi:MULTISPECIES: helix-turn-helix domain-containing protein [Burkholderiaceae]|uniref:helix-turn-helix domain-containing protein n=1 Tax=Burkholderiaceae TaxID=119060 RepID=UPI000555F7C0|nr:MULTISPECIES: helix-turn-helix domain-containing protein [Burkholderiaceae]